MTADLISLFLTPQTKVTAGASGIPVQGQLLSGKGVLGGSVAGANFIDLILARIAAENGLQAQATAENSGDGKDNGKAAVVLLPLLLHKTALPGEAAATDNKESLKIEDLLPPDFFDAPQAVKTAEDASEG